jgi:ATP-dependent helicase/nuclease subunit B
MMAAAWPSLPGESDVAIATRATRRDSGARPVPLEIVSTISLEEESIAIARQVLRWRQAGIDSIALVALDLLTARRVRALLERAQIAVRDETGWKLSTTSAAAAVMRWYDLVADDLYWRDLLDWLKSSFTLAGRPNKAEEIFAFEKAIRAGGAVQGTRAIRSALSAFPDPPAAGAREVLALIELQAQAARRAGPTLVAHARALQRARRARMRSALAADPVEVLVARSRGTRKRTGGVRRPRDAGRLSCAAGGTIRGSGLHRPSVDSPVVMVSLAATALRRFDAALLIGADARTCRVCRPNCSSMTNAVRAELGLATAERAQQAQSALLAALLASVPRVATWRSHRGDEPNPLSPLLEAVAVRHAACTDDAMLREPAHDIRAVDAVTQAPRHPARALAAGSCLRAPRAEPR